MEIIRDISALPQRYRGSAVSIGNFDGVHRGHARIIECLQGLAEKVAGPVVVFTFDPHPVRILRPEQVPPPLTWTKRKAELLSELCVDAMVVYPTDKHILSLEPQDFFQQIVCQRLSARALAEGPNFCFGRDRAGNIETLTDLCNVADIPLQIVEPLLDGGEFISSSRIRKAIHNGHVDDARRLLTQPYRIRGMVTHGAARGAKIGFPTANLAAIDTLIPAEGVYAGRIIREDKTYAAAINVGPNPTFGEHLDKVEVHVVDFSGNLYGEPLEVDFLSRLRDIHPFEDSESLKRQLGHDVRKTREIVESSGLR
jgi:riboflavin kinase/FMN adenylyltransferase